MLVLSRKPMDQLVLRVPASSEPQEIVITAVQWNTVKCRIGVTADKTVSIHRKEVQDRIDAGLPRLTR